MIQPSPLLIPAELYQVPVVGVEVPIMWFYLLMNVITQYPLPASALWSFLDCLSTGMFVVLTVQ